MNSVDSNQRHFRAKSPTSAVNPVLCAVVAEVIWRYNGCARLFPKTETGFLHKARATPGNCRDATSTIGN
jgi:hypothetical protein